MDNLEKQLFEETQEKQSKLAKKLVLGIFGGIGMVFALLGIIFIGIDNDAMQILSIVFLSVGVFMTALGLLLFFVIPTNYSYEKYKLRVNKYGMINIFEINAKIRELEDRIDQLEKDKDS